VRLVPEAVVLHAGGGTAGDRDNAFRHLHTTRNRMIVAAKLLEPHRAALAWALSLAEDSAAVANHLAHGRLATAGRAAAGKARGVAAAVAALRGIRRRRASVERRCGSAELRRYGVLEPLALRRPPGR